MLIYPIALTIIVAVIIFRTAIPKFLVALAIVISLIAIGAKAADASEMRLTEQSCVMPDGSTGVTPVTESLDSNWGVYKNDCHSLQLDRQWVVTYTYDAIYLKADINFGPPDPGEVDGHPNYHILCGESTNDPFPGGRMIAICAAPGIPDSLPFHGESNVMEIVVTPKLETPTLLPIIPVAPTVTEPVSAAVPTPTPVIARLQKVIDDPTFSETDADILRLYRAFFDREPDVEGAVYWLNQARLGMSYDDIAWNFSNSSEFKNSYGSLSDPGFVELIYLNVLDRGFDQGGFAYWTGEINTGLPRHLVVRWIAASSEFVMEYPYGRN